MSQNVLSELRRTRISGVVEFVQLLVADGAVIALCEYVPTSKRKPSAIEADVLILPRVESTGVAVTVLDGEPVPSVLIAETRKS